MIKPNQLIEISVVVPVYGCCDCLEELCQRLSVVLTSLVSRYEIILVDDASPDNAWGKVLHLSNNDSRVRGVRLSRNFGQHKAITAGLGAVKGNWVVVMDCDLQDRPEEIPKLYRKAKEGYEVVFARRENRQDSFFKKTSSRIFYKIISYMTDANLDSSIANFGIYHRAAIEAVKSMGETCRYFPVMIRWVGFSSISVNVKHSSRYMGSTSYSLKRLINLSVDVMVSFTEKPLKLIVSTGISVSILSTLYALYIFINAISGNVSVEGWASVMVSIWFVSGMIMTMVGVVGVYIGKCFEETKKRPQYIISDMTGSNKDNV